MSLKQDLGKNYIQFTENQQINTHTPIGKGDESAIPSCSSYNIKKMYTTQKAFHNRTVLE